MTRLRLALAGALVVLLALPATGADAAWSTQQQVKGQLSTAAPAIGVDETGTMALGLGGVNPASYIERPPGIAEWNSAGVTITKITGAPPSAVFALSSSGAAVVAWSVGPFLSSVPWAAYKPPGKPWGVATQLDDAAVFNGPIPLIDEAGNAAVVWARKSSSYDLNMPNQVVSSSPTATSWPASPTKLGDITVPEPEIGNTTDGFKFSSCIVDLRAAILPGGTPVAAWNDAYGSYKQSGTADSQYEVALCSVKATSGGATVDVTPRPTVGWFAAPAANMPSWTQTGVVASATDSKTAIVLRGLADSLLLSGCFEVDACANQERETRVGLGTSASLALAGSNLLGIKEIPFVALRNERTLVVSDGPSTVLRAGVGTGFPALTPLPEDFQLIGAGLALNDDGAGHIASFGNNISVNGLRLFDAPAAAAFAGPQIVDTSSGASRTAALALDCKGVPVMAWSRNSSNQIFTSNFDTAPSVCGDDPDPEPEGPGPKTGGGGTPTGPTVIETAAPAPLRLATIGLPKVDPNASKVSFEISCSPLTVNACGGKVTITKSNGGKARKSSKTGVTIGSVSFSNLKPGEKKALKVPLVSSAKQALRSGKSIKATITATVHDGSGTTRQTTKSVTLKPPG